MCFSHRGDFKFIRVDFIFHIVSGIFFFQIVSRGQKWREAYLWKIYIYISIVRKRT